MIFDQYSRYKACSDLLRQTEYVAGNTVLDIGSGPECLFGQFMPDAVMSYVDPLITNVSEPGYIAGNVFSGELDGMTYDCATSVDVLEHVPAEKRKAFLKRMSSLVNSTMVIGFPSSDTPIANEVDTILEAKYHEIYGKDYSWLEEHHKYGLPSLADTVAQLKELGWHCQAIGHGYAPWLEDLLSFVIDVWDIPELQNIVLDVSEKFNRKLYKYDYASPCYRHFIIASRNELPEICAPYTAHNDQEARVEFSNLLEEAKQQYFVQSLGLITKQKIIVQDWQERTAELDQLVVSLNRKIEESSSWARSLQTHLAERDEQTNDLHHKIEEVSVWGRLQQDKLAERDQHLVELRNEITKRKESELDLNNRLEVSKSKEKELGRQLVELRNEITKRKESELDLNYRLEALQSKEKELGQMLEISQGMERELTHRIEAAQEREIRLAHNLEQTQQYHHSLLSYQAGLKRMLDQERFSILRPILRRLYRRAVSIALMMPAWLQRWMKRLKTLIIQRPITLQIPAWEIAISPESVSDACEIFSVLNCESCGYDIIVFPVIDWHFRVQRPQHIAKGMADKGHRVFYLSVGFGDGAPDGVILEQIESRVFVCQLNIPAPHPVIYERMASPKQEQWINEALSIFMSSVRAQQVVAIVNHPFWRPAALAIQGAVVVYDCMDDHGGFSNNADEILQSEEQLIWQSDLVVTTSAPLSEKISKKRNNILIRNAADSEWFSQSPEVLAYSSGRPVVGYFGAISEWFDIELIIRSAKSYPEYDFLLVGSTYMCDTRKAELMDNIYFIGEVPYAEIKSYLYAFDICLIPFQLVELIKCTNPVKLYEYLASGKPVVATAMPELRMVEEHVFVSDDDDDFINNIRLAMESKDEPGGISSRKAFAMENRWINRVDQLQEAITNNVPLVSIVVLTYNNLDYTRACLYSIEKFTHYPNLELIVVDNASSDGSGEYLSEYEKQHEKVKVILNEANVGFSAGNNIGIKQATGEYVVLLNNDTYVTSGWLWGLIRYFQKDNLLGLIGPVTNNIGNEAKIDIQYSNMEEMAEAARKYTQQRSRQLLYINTAAFFCVAIRKTIIDEIGLLDEAFGRGYFEDDDYCMRARKAGYKVAIADDVFVHHQLSASFNALKEQEKQLLFDKNKAIYEEKWGTWLPHSYRDTML